MQRQYLLLLHHVMQTLKFYSFPRYASLVMWLDFAAVLISRQNYFSTNLFVWCSPLNLVTQVTFIRHLSLGSFFLCFASFSADKIIFPREIRLDWCEAQNWVWWLRRVVRGWGRGGGGGFYRALGHGGRGGEFPNVTYNMRGKVSAGGFLNWTNATFANLQIFVYYVLF